MFPLPVPSHRGRRSVRVQEALRLCDQRVLQNHSSLLVLLTLLRRKFVHPTEFRFAVLAHHIADHVSPRQHHPVLHSAVGQVDDAFEQVRSTWKEIKKKVTQRNLGFSMFPFLTSGASKSRAD